MSHRALPRCGGRRADLLPSRPPGSSGPNHVLHAATATEQRQPEQHGRAHRDGTVSDVEREPAADANTHIEKVGDAAIAQPVCDVGEAPAENQADRAAQS